jgi:hypothetical protein
MGDSRIKDISALLSSFFSGDKLRHGEHYSDFFASWESMVGPRLAAHSRVADVDKGLLVIVAEHPGWIQLLQLRQSSIIAEVSRRYPELGLRGIVFKLEGQVALPHVGYKQKVQEKDLVQETAEEKAVRARALEDIPDPEFRAILSSLKKTMQGKD